MLNEKCSDVIDKLEFGPAIKMTDLEFQKFNDLIYSYLGIHLTVAKKVMVESRLQRRLKELNFKTFRNYYDFVTNEQNKEELIQFANLITTNKTDFFREPHHFNFLFKTILPTFKQNAKIRIWSAGCSSGEEPYTIAMVLAEFNELCYNVDSFLIGSDISVEMMKKCQVGIYGIDRVANIPNDLKVKYFLKGKNAHSQTVRVIPELRNKVTLNRLNFMDDNYSKINGMFDVIFCRNVIIYFDKSTQEAVLNKLAKKLNKGGYLFLGHSESIIDFELPLEQIKPTIFRKI